MESLAPACSNCGNALPPQARFCTQCAQRTRFGPRSLRETVQEVVGRDYSPDGRLWLTLRRLVQPGRLTRDWFAGRQQRYLGPMRLLLLVLLVTVLSLQLLMRLAAPGAAGQTGTHAWLVEYGPAWAGQPPLLDQRQGSVRVVVHGGGLQPLLQAWAGRVQQALATMTEAELRLRLQTQTTPARWQARLLTLPLLVLALAAVHAGQGRLLAEHAVLALHFAAFALATIVVVAPLELLGSAMPVGEVIGLILALWFTLALRRFYGGAWWAVGLRSVFVLGLLIVPVPYLDTLVALTTLA